MLRRVGIAIVDGVGQGRDGVDGLVLEAQDRLRGHVRHSHGQRHKDHEERVNDGDAGGEDTEHALRNLGKQGRANVGLPRSHRTDVRPDGDGGGDEHAIKHEVEHGGHDATGQDLAAEHNVRAYPQVDRLQHARLAHDTSQRIGAEERAIAVEAGIMQAP